MFLFFVRQRYLRRYLLIQMLTGMNNSKINIGRILLISALTALCASAPLYANGTKALVNILIAFAVVMMIAESGIITLVMYIILKLKTKYFPSRIIMYLFATVAFALIVAAVISYAFAYILTTRVGDDYNYLNIVIHYAQLALYIVIIYKLFKKYLLKQKDIQAGK